MNKIFRVSLVVLLISGSGLWAQDPDTQLHSVATPVAPFVARAPAKSAWSIEIKSAGKGPLAVGSMPDQPQKYLKGEVWVKSGPFMKCDCDWSDGTKTEDWVAGRVKFYQDPFRKGLHILNPQSDGMNHDFAVSDFEKLDWIGADDYVGVFNYSEQPCYLFQAKDVATGPHGGETGLPNKTLRQVNAPTSATKVYISVRTKLPVAIINGDGEFTFHYLSPPEDALVMPEPVASLWKAFSGH